MEFNSMSKRESPATLSTFRHLFVSSGPEHGTRAHAELKVVANKEFRQEFSLNDYQMSKHLAISNSQIRSFFLSPLRSAQSSRKLYFSIHLGFPLSSFKVPHSHIPYGPDGSGYYSDNELGCCDVILEAEPLVLDAIRLATVEPVSVFTIADYGCADGGTSMPLLYACVQELRKTHGDDLPISVIYEDQLVNDFKSLFLRLQGIKEHFHFDHELLSECYVLASRQTLDISYIH